VHRPPQRNFQKHVAVIVEHFEDRSRFKIPEGYFVSHALRESDRGIIALDRDMHSYRCDRGIIARSRFDRSGSPLIPSTSQRIRCTTFLKRSEMRQSLMIVSAFVPLAISASASLAQGTAEQRRACTRDALKLCMDAIPDPERVAECLRENRDQLSDRCARYLPPRAEREQDERR